MKVKSGSTYRARAAAETLRGEHVLPHSLIEPDDEVAGCLIAHRNDDELGRMDSNHHSGIQSPASCL